MKVGSGGTALAGVCVDRLLCFRLQNSREGPGRGAFRVKISYFCITILLNLQPTHKYRSPRKEIVYLNKPGQENMTVLSLTYFSVTRFLATWLFIFQTTIVFSQANCPVNLDFENGNFSNWQCLRGHVLADNSNNILQLNPVAPGDVHKIISSDNSTLDPYGRFPVSCSNGSRYSVKLGNNTGGHEAEALAYTFTIPASVNNFAIVYNYAIVLQNPGHQPHEQPRFRGRVIDVATDAEINCVSFDFAASSSLPGFKPSRDYQGVLYKDWTPVFVDLSEYAGRTVRLEFITSDCTNNQHFGYAYIDVNSVCSNNFMAASLELR